MTTASARLLVGRRIIGYDARRFQGRRSIRGRGQQVAHAPIILLDNGASLSFTVEETDGGEYGVCINYHPRRS